MKEISINTSEGFESLFEHHPLCSLYVKLKNNTEITAVEYLDLLKNHHLDLNIKIRVKTKEIVKGNTEYAFIEEIIRLSANNYSHHVMLTPLRLTFYYFFPRENLSDHRPDEIGFLSWLRLDQANIEFLKGLRLRFGYDNGVIDHVEANKAFASAKYVLSKWYLADAFINRHGVQKNDAEAAEILNAAHAVADQCMGREVPQKVGDSYYLVRTLMREQLKELSSSKMREADAVNAVKEFKEEASPLTKNSVDFQYLECLQRECICSTGDSLNYDLFFGLVSQLQLKVKLDEQQKKKQNEWYYQIGKILIYSRFDSATYSTEKCIAAAVEQFERAQSIQILEQLNEEVCSSLTASAKVDLQFYKKYLAFWEKIWLTSNFSNQDKRYLLQLNLGKALIKAYKEYFHEDNSSEAKYCLTQGVIHLLEISDFGIRALKDLHSNSQQQLDYQRECYHFGVSLFEILVKLTHKNPKDDDLTQKIKKIVLIQFQQADRNQGVIFLMGRCVKVDLRPGPGFYYEPTRPGDHYLDKDIFGSSSNIGIAQQLLNELMVDFDPIIAKSQSNAYAEWDPRRLHGYFSCVLIGASVKEASPVEAQYYYQQALKYLKSLGNYGWSFDYLIDAFDQQQGVLKQYEIIDRLLPDVLDQINEPVQKNIHERLGMMLVKWRRSHFLWQYHLKQPYQQILANADKHFRFSGSVKVLIYLKEECVKGHFDEDLFQLFKKQFSLLGQDFAQNTPVEIKEFHPKLGAFLVQKIKISRSIQNIQAELNAAQADTKNHNPVKIEQLTQELKEVRERIEDAVDQLQRTPSRFNSLEYVQKEFIRHDPFCRELFEVVNQLQLCSAPNSQNTFNREVGDYSATIASFSEPEKVRQREMHYEMVIVLLKARASNSDRSITTYCLGNAIAQAERANSIAISGYSKKRNMAFQMIKEQCFKENHIDFEIYELAKFLFQAPQAKEISAMNHWNKKLGVAFKKLIEGSISEYDLEQSFERFLSIQQENYSEYFQDFFELQRKCINKDGTINFNLFDVVRKFQDRLFVKLNQCANFYLIRQFDVLNAIIAAFIITIRKIYKSTPAEIIVINRTIQKIILVESNKHTKDNSQIENKSEDKNGQDEVASSAVSGANAMAVLTPVSVSVSVPVPVPVTTAVVRALSSESEADVNFSIIWCFEMAIQQWNFFGDNYKPIPVLLRLQENCIDDQGKIDLSVLVKIKVLHASIAQQKASAKNTQEEDSVYFKLGSALVNSMSSYLSDAKHEDLDRNNNASNGLVFNQSENVKLDQALSQAKNYFHEAVGMFFKLSNQGLRNNGLLLLQRACVSSKLDLDFFMVIKYLRSKMVLKDPAQVQQQIDLDRLFLFTLIDLRKRNCIAQEDYEREALCLLNHHQEVTVGNIDDLNWLHSKIIHEQSIDKDIYDITDLFRKTYFKPGAASDVSLAVCYYNFGLACEQHAKKDKCSADDSAFCRDNAVKYFELALNTRDVPSLMSYEIFKKLGELYQQAALVKDADSNNQKGNQYLLRFFISQCKLLLGGWRSEILFSDLYSVYTNFSEKKHTTTLRWNDKTFALSSANIDELNILAEELKEKSFGGDVLDIFLEQKAESTSPSEFLNNNIEVNVLYNRLISINTDMTKIRMGITIPVKTLSSLRDELVGLIQQQTNSKLFSFPTKRALLAIFLQFELIDDVPNSLYNIKQKIMKDLEGVKDPLALLEKAHEQYADYGVAEAVVNTTVQSIFDQFISPSVFSLYPFEPNLPFRIYMQASGLHFKLNEQSIKKRIGDDLMMSGATPLQDIRHLSFSPTSASATTTDHKEDPDSTDIQSIASSVSAASMAFQDSLSSANSKPRNLKDVQSNLHAASQKGKVPFFRFTQVRLAVAASSSFHQTPTNTITNDDL